MRGVGLRRVLHPYINTKSVLSVLFCISPSKVNQKATIATLKFAVQAGMVKVKPVKEAVMTNWPMLVMGLKAMIEALNGDIDEHEKQIHAQQEEINRLMDDLQSAKVGTEHRETVSSRKSTIRAHHRKRSTMPKSVHEMLEAVHKNDEIQEEDQYDEKDRADIDELGVDDAMNQAIKHPRGEQEAVASVLGIEKEEYIRKSTIFSQTINFRESVNKHLAMVANQNIDDNFTYDDNQNMGEQQIDYEQDHMETDGWDRDQLAERCEVLESMLEAEKAMNESYLYSQQVIIDHLAETNEGLLQFFRVKFKLLDTVTSGVKKKKKKKKNKM